MREVTYNVRAQRSVWITRLDSAVSAPLLSLVMERIALYLVSGEHFYTCGMFFICQIGIYGKKTLRLQLSEPYLGTENIS